MQISSIGGVVAFPSVGIYHASKWALEGLSDTLAQEVASVGVKVALVEPGFYGTDWAAGSATHSAPNPVYQPLCDAMEASLAGFEVGEPGGVADAVLEIADSEHPPRRFLAGDQAFDTSKAAYGQRLAT